MTARARRATQTRDRFVAKLKRIAQNKKISDDDVEKWFFKQLQQSPSFGKVLAGLPILLSFRPKLGEAIRTQLLKVLTPTKKRTRVKKHK